MLILWSSKITSEVEPSLPCDAYKINCVGYQCPVNGECLKSDLVYSCKVESANEVREYIGSTKNSFKVRWNAHNSDARYISKRTKTTLADYIWSLKEKNIVYSQSWKVELSTKVYCPEIGVCLSEKYWLLKNHKVRKLVNKRTEILNKCRHRAPFLLASV